MPRVRNALTAVASIRLWQTLYTKKTWKIRRPSSARGGTFLGTTRPARAVIATVNRQKDSGQALLALAFSGGSRDYKDNNRSARC